MNDTGTSYTFTEQDKRIAFWLAWEKTHGYYAQTYTGTNPNAFNLTKEYGSYLAEIVGHKAIKGSLHDPHPEEREQHDLLLANKTIEIRWNDHQGTDAHLRVSYKELQHRHADYYVLVTGTITEANHSIPWQVQGYVSYAEISTGITLQYKPGYPKNRIWHAENMHPIGELTGKGGEK